MIELPEAVAIAGQIGETYGGRTVISVVAGASPHRFAWFQPDAAKFDGLLAGKTVGGASGVGMYMEAEVGDMVLSTSAPVRYLPPGARRPLKHQLLIEYDDGSALSSRVQLWGGYFVFPQGELGGSKDRRLAVELPSPLSDAFDWAYFCSLMGEGVEKLSAKAFLATEQRIPGLGNGVLQDILWTARVHPKRKMGDLLSGETHTMFDAVRSVLAEMTDEGGRDTEKDLFGEPGGYRTVLSRNTVGAPCPACGETIAKASYLGGAIYWCPGCQPA